MDGAKLRPVRLRSNVSGKTVLEEERPTAPFTDRYEYISVQYSVLVITTLYYYYLYKLHRIVFLKLPLFKFLIFHCDNTSIMQM